jgi:hypothetical protein
MTPSSPSVAQPPPQWVTDAVDSLFCSPHSARYGPYTRIGDGTEVIPDRVYRYRMQTAADEPVALQLYRGLNDLGGQLWEQESRVLLRVTARGHPALPRILDGGYDEERNLGFAVADTADLTLASDLVMRELRGRKADCVRMLARLADALALLHGQGVMHRNLHPDTITALGSTPDRIDRLRLERFEMSGLITNVLRRQRRDEGGSDEVRQFLRQQGARALAYFPPERVALLDPAAEPGAGYETDRSDVYGLGVLGWEFFVGPIPPDHLAGPEVGSVAWARRLNESLRADLRRQRELPRPLVDLLTEMLDRGLTSAQVVDYVAKHYDALTAPWESQKASRSHLVLFMPVQSGPTVHEWGWIPHSPDRPEGKVPSVRSWRTSCGGPRWFTPKTGPSGMSPLAKGRTIGPRPSTCCSVAVERGSANCTRRGTLGWCATKPS